MANNTRNIKQQPGTGHWIGSAGDEFRALFVYESDAIEWRAADPLNRGTIGELVERFVLPEAAAKN